MRGPVSAGKFTGTCEVCGDTAELRSSSTTALLQAQNDMRLSAIATGLVRCHSGDHAYYVLLWDTQVNDPFEEGEPEVQPIVNIELPPPPPPKEDA